MPASFSIQTIGILGGGQLGRMMALAAKAMGFRIVVLDPEEDCPCAQVADKQILADYSDEIACRELLQAADVITYEFENVPVTSARILEDKLPQGSRLLEITQDRMLEKQSVRDLGFLTADYLPIRNPAELENFTVHFLQNPGKVFLKTTRGGYDGKGQFVLQTAADLQEFSEKHYRSELTYVAETALNFDMELSAIVCRNARGESSVFPIAENIHRNQILHQSIVPARVPEHIHQKAKNLALEIAEGIQLQGTLAIELFLCGDELRVNELAPRPHNSGHYSLDACLSSQFEQHIRAICNLPLGDVHQVSPCVMLNLLGEDMERLSWEKAGKHKLHLYGKKEARPGRKMGHINILENSIEECLKSLENIF
jgi:5-(carboxyamino)imidazole ribonucleotide synthase